MDGIMGKSNNEETGTGFSVSSSDILERIDKDSSTDSSSYNLPYRKTDEEVLEEVGIQFNVEDNYDVTILEERKQLAIEVHEIVDERLEDDVEKEVYNELVFSNKAEITERHVKEEFAEVMINNYSQIKRYDQQTSLNRLANSLDLR